MQNTAFINKKYLVLTNVIQPVNPVPITKKNTRIKEYISFNDILMQTTGIINNKHLALTNVFQRVNPVQIKENTGIKEFISFNDI